MYSLPPGTSGAAAPRRPRVADERSFQQVNPVVDMAQHPAGVTASPHLRQRGRQALGGVPLPFHGRVQDGQRRPEGGRALAHHLPRIPVGFDADCREDDVDARYLNERGFRAGHVHAVEGWKLAVQSRGDVVVAPDEHHGQPLDHCVAQHAFPAGEQRLRVMDGLLVEEITGDD